MDLTKGELKLFEDRQEQEVYALSWGKPRPLIVGVLLDISGSRQDEVTGAERNVVPNFFRWVVGKGDLASVITFNEQAYVLSDLTDSFEKLDAAVQLATETSPRGKTALYDAIAKACLEQFSKKVGRKALVIVSDGVDNASRTRQPDAIRLAHLTDTVMYAIEVLPSVPYRQNRTPEEAIGGRVLQEFAEQTGGRVFTVSYKRYFEAAFEQIAQELRGLYLLEYYPSNAARDGKFRKLKIKTTRKGVKLFFRKGYYAPKN